MLYFSAEAYDPLLSNWEYHNQMGYHAVDFRWLCCKYTVRASPIMGVSPNRSAHEDDMTERGEEREGCLALHATTGWSHNPRCFAALKLGSGLKGLDKGTWHKVSGKWTIFDAKEGSVEK